MHKITLPQNSSSNCFDSIIYSLLKYFNFDYEVYNIKYFYTDYYKENVNNIQYCICRGKYTNILKDIYNIDLCYMNTDNLVELFDIIKRVPVCVIIDPYYCHWSPFYQKGHYSHFLLIIGINYHEKKYVCFDVHFDSVGYIEIDFDIINKNVEQYFVFNFEKTNEVRLKLVIDKLKTSLDRFNNDLDIKKTELADYFLTSDRNILFPKNLETSIPLICLMWIAEDKKNFSILLRYIENKIEGKFPHSLYDLLTISQQSFVLLKTTLIKYAITGILKEDKLKNILNQIFDTDARIVEQIQNILIGKM